RAPRSRPQPTGPRHPGQDTQPDLRKTANLAALPHDTGIPQDRPAVTRSVTPAIEDLYSFQLLIPGLDLREAAYWLPNSDSHPWGLLLMIYTWLMIILGWVLATAVVAGITQLFRRR